MKNRTAEASNKKKYLIYLTQISISILFIILFLDWFSKKPFCCDLGFFYRFVEYYPEFYVPGTTGEIWCIYLPYFYLFFYPLSLIDSHQLYIIFSILNAFLIGDIVRKSSKINNTAFIITTAGVFIGVWSLSRWANPELLVAWVHFHALQKVIKNGKLNWYDACILSFFSFKIVSFLFIALIFCKIDQKYKLKFLLAFVISQILLIVPFIILNPQLLQIEYILYIFSNRASMMSFFLVMLYRISLLMPTLYFIVEMIRIILKQKSFADVIGINFKEIKSKLASKE